MRRGIQLFNCRYGFCCGNVVRVRVGYRHMRMELRTSDRCAGVDRKRGGAKRVAEFPYSPGRVGGEAYCPRSAPKAADSNIKRGNFRADTHCGSLDSAEPIRRNLIGKRNPIKRKVQVAGIGQIVVRKRNGLLALPDDGMQRRVALECQVPVIGSRTYGPRPMVMQLPYIPEALKFFRAGKVPSLHASYSPRPGTRIDSGHGFKDRARLRNVTPPADNVTDKFGSPLLNRDYRPAR